MDRSRNPQVKGTWRDAHAFWRREHFRGALSQDGLAALDSLFSYYRSPPGDVYCTTEEVITATRTRAGRVLQRERFTDSTCPGRPFSEVRGLEEILGHIFYGDDYEPLEVSDLAESA
jgi:hypothetical protein